MVTQECCAHSLGLSQTTATYVRRYSIISKVCQLEKLSAAATEVRCQLCDCEIYIRRRIDSQIASDGLTCWAPDPPVNEHEGLKDQIFRGRGAAAIL